jgi:hypothetical protein
MPINDEDALAGITIGVRVLQDVEQVAALNVEHDILEPDPALFPELRVLRVVPGKVLHYWQDSTDVCLVGTHWHRSECAQECAQTRSTERHPAPNASQETNEKRA